MVKKAYIVHDGDEKTVVVFATSGAAARRIGANEMDTEFEGVESCRRAPHFDAFAAKGFVPAEELIEAGWRFECNGCSGWVDRDRVEYDAEGDETDRKTVPIFEDHGVWCSAECKADYEEDRRIKKAMEAAAIEDFKRRVLKRFPDAEFVPDHTFRAHHAYAQQCDGIYSLEQVVVTFDFPGRKVGVATYRWDMNGEAHEWALVGPREPHFMCCNGDKEAFEAWARGDAVPSEREKVAA